MLMNGNAPWCVCVCRSAERDGRYLAVNKAAQSTSVSPVFSIRFPCFLSVLHEWMLPANTKLNVCL